MGKVLLEWVSLDLHRMSRFLSIETPEQPQPQGTQIQIRCHRRPRIDFRESYLGPLPRVDPG